MPRAFENAFLQSSSPKCPKAAFIAKWGEAWCEDSYGGVWVADVTTCWLDGWTASTCLNTCGRNWKSKESVVSAVWSRLDGRLMSQHVASEERVPQPTGAPRLWRDIYATEEWGRGLWLQLWWSQHTLGAWWTFAGAWRMVWSCSILWAERGCYTWCMKNKRKCICNVPWWCCPSNYVWNILGP